jgi:hypothetical protein
LSVSVSHWPHGEEWSSENPNLCHRELRAEENPTNQARLMGSSGPDWFHWSMAFDLLAYLSFAIEALVI